MENPETGLHNYTEVTFFFTKVQKQFNGRRIVFSTTKKDINKQKEKNKRISIQTSHLIQKQLKMDHRLKYIKQIL